VSPARCRDCPALSEFERASVKPRGDSADQIGMQNLRKPMLFSPPLPPIELNPDHPIVIGRQANCDLSLEHHDVSRRHSELSHEDGHWVLRDLGSTNGTFLNGKEITTPSVLSPGDRIEMGSRIVTFCELEADVFEATQDADPAQTMIANRSSSNETLAGDLSQIPPSAVLQVLEMGRKSGILEIDAEAQSCRLWFREGVPVHAQSEKQTGFDAALGIVNLEVGRFRFASQSVSVETTMACTVTQLLMEGCRILDEENA
jgi:pSer/pThr/pTyr-binding forkhead associated (FHA) protein